MSVIYFKNISRTTGKKSSCVAMEVIATTPTSAYFFLVEFLPQLTQHRTRFLVQCKIKGGFIRPRLVEQTFYYIIKYEMHFEQEREFGNSEYISAYQTLLGLASGHGGILIQLQVSFG